MIADWVPVAVVPRTAAFLSPLMFVQEFSGTVQVCFQVSGSNVGSFQVIVGVDLAASTASSK